MNNKGFTMIELLVTIALLAIVSTISVISITAFVNKSKENNYEKLAYETVKLEITLGDNPYKGEDIPISVAKRDRRSEIVVV